MKRILYLNSFTVKTSDFGSSDAIGYGITSSGALFQALERHYHLTAVPTPSEKNTPAAYLEWTLGSYQEVLAQLLHDPPDGIFIFHSFQQFPQELKKMLYHLKLNVPLIGYTHGSHWDATDTFRHIHCPGLQLSDLANLYCLDAILFVTHTFKNTVIESIRQFNAATADDIERKSFVVGLPINTGLIDAHATQKNNGPPLIVFNHAPVPSKNLNIFLNVIEKVLKKYPEARCHITRNIKPDCPEYQRAHQLSRAFPQLTLHQTLPISEYYALLWQSNIQVSTASHESLGVATLEAMYTYNCCILPNIGAYPEISKGTTEHLYETENELLDKLNFYIEHPEQREQLAKKLKKAAGEYAMPQLEKTFIAVIEAALK